MQFTSEVFKNIKNLSKFTKSQIKESMDGLIKNPFTGNQLERDLKGLWSLHVGDYRVIYEVEKKQKLITVYAIDSRKVVYLKSWLRKKAKKIRKSKK